MPETIRLSVDVSVDGGPGVSAAPSMAVGAYDKLDVTVDAIDSGTPGEATAALQPGTAAQVRVLMITASRYGEDLEFDLGGETIELDSPQLYTGSGMMSLFGSDPQQIVLRNSFDNPVTVSVLVGRSTS